MMATVRTESVEGLTQSHEALLRFGRAFSMMCRRAAAGRQDVDFWHFARQIATFGFAIQHHTTASAGLA